MHSLGFSHNSLRPKSIYLTKSKTSGLKVKLGGFSKSRQTRSVDTEEVRPVSPADAPEVQMGSRFSFESDMWSLGFLLYYLVTGRDPF